MSQSSQLAIRNIIESCEPVTSEIRRLIHSGLTCTKDLCDRLNESHSQSPDATRQRLARMVKAGELIRMRRGAYALPNASCDFLPDAAPTAPQTSTSPPLEFGIIPALTHLSAPHGISTETAYTLKDYTMYQVLNGSNRHNFVRIAPNLTTLGMVKGSPSSP